MSGFLGTWQIDDLLSWAVNTQVFATGVATDADAAPAYRLYEDETGTPILTGNMALLDSANTAGFYSEQITLSAANGFEVGKSYTIHISATVSGVAGATSRSFQVKALPATAAALATVAGEVTAIKAKTDNLPTDPADQSLIIVATDAVMTRIGVAGAGLTALGDARLANLDATISSRLATASYTAPPSAADVWAAATRTLTAGTNIQLPSNGLALVTAWTVDLTGSLSGSVGSVAGLTPGNLDVAVSTRLATSGYTAPPTAAANADAVWDEALAGHLVAGSTGFALNAAGSSGDPWGTALPGAYGAGTAGAILGGYTAPPTAIDIWANTTRTLTAGTNIALAKGTGITGFNDLSAADVNAEADAALLDVGLTLAKTAFLDAAITSRMASFTYTAPDNAGITAMIATLGVAGAGLTALGDTRLGNLDAAITSRMATFAYTAPDNIGIDAAVSGIALVMAKTDLIPAAPAAVGDIPTAIANAAALLAYDMGNGRLVAEAFYKLRNRVSINSATNVLTVYGTDDATPSWTELLSVDAAALPIVGSNPI